MADRPIGRFPLGWNGKAVVPEVKPVDTFIVQPQSHLVGMICPFACAWRDRKSSCNCNTRQSFKWIKYRLFGRVPVAVCSYQLVVIKDFNLFLLLDFAKSKTFL